MYVVSPTQGLLAAGVDICSEVVLVGRLVGREARVAIEAVGGIFNCDVSNGVVDRREAGNGIGHARFEIFPHCLILLSMLLKPGAVVVGRHL